MPAESLSPESASSTSSFSYFIDSHCHLHDAEFFDRPTVEDLILAARDQRVRQLICIGTSHVDSLQAAEFATSHQDIFWTYGIHPGEVNSKNLSKLTAAVSSFSKSFDAASLAVTVSSSEPNKDAFSSFNFNKLEKPVAVGEIGLDYHYPGYDRDAQIALFECQLQLAKDLDLPVVFHIREAFEDFFGVIANFPYLTAVVHSFSDSRKNLERSLSHGFYIGINGIATFASIPLPPLDRALLETDAPFLAPTPVRGKTNHPAYIPHIATFLANHYDCTLSAVADTTTKNTRDFYRLPVCTSA